MAIFHQFALSTTAIPKKWQQIFLKSSLNDTPSILTFDAFQNGSQMEIISGFDERKKSLLDQIEFVTSSGPLAPLKTVFSPRASHIAFENCATDFITLLVEKERIRIPVQNIATDVFAGRNVLFTIVSEPDPAVVVDWLTYHAKTEGAETALIFLRGNPQFNSARFCGELRHLSAQINMLDVAVVDVTHPLGHPNMPAESSRHLAPDAPGKSQLANPISDPWRSPVFELAILEVARCRFLRKARAVLFCNTSDLVYSNTDQTVFDAAQSGTGLIKIAGIRAYPFSIPDLRRPRHQDHNCRSFDGEKPENLWCATPSNLESGNLWRHLRTSLVENDQEANPFGYWRCMAIRHPDLKVSELVPKSSLVLEPDLDATVRREFNGTPNTPPERKRFVTKKLSNDKVLIISTMKNEGPFILEWVAYHRAIGVSDFLVYSNDCSDGTDDILALLAAKGFLDHKANPYRELDLTPQHAAFVDADETEVAKAADWIICMDVDEFINVHIGDGTLNDLFNAVADATQISITWRLFGNADVDRFEDRPVIEQFTKSAPIIIQKPHQAWGFKTLFRNLGHYKKLGVHRPKGLRPEYLDQINWVNGSGDPMPDNILRSGWRSTVHTIGYSLVSLNHYALRSAESFLVKRDRGRVNHVDRDQGLGYWFRMNHNAQENRKIANKLPAFHRELARLMSDPEIAAQHLKCVAAHRAKISELQTLPEYLHLYNEITGDRLRALSRLLHHFGNQTFLDGPSAVPPDFHLTHKS